MIEDILSFRMHVDESKGLNTFSEMVFLSMSISLCHPLGLSKVVGHQNNPSKPLYTIFETIEKTQEFWVNSVTCRSDGG